MLSCKRRENILNFSTYALFSKYAPVYFTAFNFFEKLYESINKKEELIKTLFTKPCTPSMMLKEFGNYALVNVLKEFLDVMFME